MASELNDTVIIAAILSRVEALCVASMLEANGVAVHVDGYHYGSAQVISLALGGHRLRIARADYQVASDLIREVGTADSWEFNWGTQRAVMRFVVFWAIVFAAPLMIFIVVAGVLDDGKPDTVPPVWMPVLVLATLPVNPQGSGDYYLAPAAD